MSNGTSRWGFGLEATGSGRRTPAPGRQLSARLARAVWLSRPPCPQSIEGHHGKASVTYETEVFRKLHSPACGCEGEARGYSCAFGSMLVRHCDQSHPLTTHAHTHAHTCTCANTCTHMHVHTPTHMHTHMHPHTHMPTHTCTHTHAQAHTCTHTHTSL